MDDPALKAESHERALKGLARINQISGTAKEIWRELQQHVNPGDKVKMLDIATGGADVPIEVLKIARQFGVTIELTVCDISERALEWAQQRADTFDLSISTFVLDVCKEDIPNQFQIVTSSLFLHHLDRDQAQAVLRRMGDAASGLTLVNDLERSVFGYCAALAASQLLTRSPIVHTDAPRSVRAAYTKQEASDMAREAGLKNVQVRRCRPFRWQLTSKP
ncbi:MAG: methyltransferase domain-containing protein [Phycisphaerales bacterium]|nr:methyltransferase domain-containing protein [Phycisphaerales bacterium]